MIPRFLALPVVALLLAMSVAAPTRGAVVPPGVSQLLDDVRALTAPEMAGRRSGTPGGDRAARLIADRLAAAGLHPGGGGGTFFQPFVLGTSTQLGPGTSFQLVGPTARTFELEKEWMPHGGSISAEVTGEVVFVGYGVVAQDVGYDDYAGVDVSGAIVVAFDRAPGLPAALRRSRLEKLLTARARGAAAVLLVGDALPSLDAMAPSIGLVAAAITREVADRLVGASGRSTAQVAAAMAGSRTSASFVTGVRARIRVDLVRAPQGAVNVVGILPGTDPARAAEVIVLGAHYDHLGTIDGRLYPGADDNASGTAAVLGLARAFAAAGGAPRTLIFTLFAAEELGLLGSSHYVKEPALPVAQTITMLNLDMVGRARANGLHVSGVDSGSGLREVVTEVAKAEGLNLTVGGDPYAQSDHRAFYAAGAPVLFFTTGGHPDHHEPTDTAEKIDGPGLERVAAVVGRVIERLANGPRPAYVTIPAPVPSPGGSPGGAFLGINVDPHATAHSVRVASVVPDSPAARAGFREGDVIVRLGSEVVENFEEIRGVLRDKRPGETVLVVYVRDGQVHHSPATLAARP